MNYILEGENKAKEAVNTLKKVFLKLKMWFLPSKSNTYSPKILQGNMLLYGVLLLFFIKVITIGLYMPWPQNIFFADITKIDLVTLLNQNRQSLGLNTLTDNNTLDNAALLKAQDMVSKDYFAHQSPQGATPWFWFRQVGYNYKYAGENLAIGFVESSEVFNAWLNSPEHKANLHNPNYKDVGTAVLSGFGNNNTIVVVQIFGSLQTPPVAAAKSVPPKNSVPIETQKNTKADTVANVPDVKNQVAVNDTSLSAPLPQVLGTTFNYQIASSKSGMQNNFYSNLMYVIMYDFQDIMRYISYLFLLVVCAYVIIHISQNTGHLQGQFIFKSLVMIIVLGGMLFINKDIVAIIVPHQLII